MAVTTKSNQIIPELFTEAVQAAFRDKDAFMDTDLMRYGICAVNGGMPAGQADIGDKISIPYLSSIGEFADLNDGDAITPTSISTTKEQATVARAGLGFDVTRWARSSVADPYRSGAIQILQSAKRKLGQALMTAAAADGVDGFDKYSSTVPHTLTYDDIVDGSSYWCDEQDGITVLAVHSKVLGDLAKLKDTTGRSILEWVLSDVPDVATGRTVQVKKPLFYGMPVISADSLPVTGGALSAVTAAGTTPPTLTISGTPLQVVNLRVECTTLGSRGTWVLRYSTNGGSSWVSDVTSAATIALNDSTTGKSTGITLAIATGTAAVDNVWTANTILKHTSLLLKPGALALWYNQAALGLQTISVPSTDSEQAFVNLYYAAYRYKHRNGGRFPGVVRLRHN